MFPLPGGFSRDPDTALKRAPTDCMFQDPWHVCLSASLPLDAVANLCGSGQTEVTNFWYRLFDLS